MQVPQEALCSHVWIFFSMFLSLSFFEKERESGEGARTEKILSRLHAVGAEPDVGLSPLTVRS